MIDKLREDFQEIVDDIEDRLKKPVNIDTPGEVPIEIAFRDDVDETNQIINDHYKEYVDKGVRVQELSRVEGKILQDKGVTRVNRISLESYVNEDDEVLPSSVMYTEEPSLVNYDSTLSWIKDKTEQTRFEQIQSGAKYASIALQWLKTNAIKSDDYERLRKSIDGILSQHAEVFKNANLDNAETPLFEFIKSFNLNPEDFDTRMEDEWSTASRKKLMLNQMVGPVIGPTLNDLTVKLALVPSFKEEFNDYIKRVNTTFKLLMDSLSSNSIGDCDTVDLSSVDGGIERITKETESYLRMSLNVGTDTGLTMDVVDGVIKSGKDYIEVVDVKYGDTLTELRTNFINSYSLEGYENKTGISVEEPDKMIRSMDQNNSVLSQLLDTMKFLIRINNSFISTADAKKRLVDAYYMFLSLLVD